MVVPGVDECPCQLHAIVTSARLRRTGIVRGKIRLHLLPQALNDTVRQLLGIPDTPHNSSLAFVFL
jgi:hypothetical protein